MTTQHTAPRLTWRERLTRIDVKAMPYALVSPYFILFAVFGVFPMGYTLYASLHAWKIGNPTREFVGLDNYTFLLTEYDRFNWSVVNTLGMFVMATVPQIVCAMMVANALNKRLRRPLLWRMLILAPIVTSVVAVGVIFARIWGNEYGMVNGALELIGLDAVNWQGGRLESWFAISSMVDWRWMGYNALIFLAAMQTIPKSLYEAATVDGASPRQQFWKITVPQLKPILIFTVFVSSVGGMTLFVEPLMFAPGTGALGGGTTGQFQTTAMVLVDILRTHGNYGISSAAGWLLFLVIGVVAALNFLVVNRIQGNK
ncbi:carbohydrate ABC transporter permease [Glycomyces algeriensis]|uniref:Sugar ABC transporter permease n=1 Tax=Glycomyces algeriensis TaxID=256037 RepID=A0A9W6G6U3_9ACTN|nr:sugar ABC transporter permease [Glycomyces algeriensis]MDA1366352.1 sugar ABC transporter permease [Glycomyces algeriensis]MDR7348700.1 cellobiose transport system permease protein [Glycomyces algeriensis]GLI41402.1 sugar ABC transporter permease [Glycomyces algeriensis]